MTRAIGRAALLPLAAAFALLVAPPSGQAEVSRTSPPPRPAVPTPDVGLVPPDELALRTQCWQEGVKIIDQPGLQGLALPETLKQQALAFQGAAGHEPRTLILPLADALCMIGPER
jgi:hypothetical protein